jgi:Protein of unknown function (DUF1761)
MEYLNVIAAAAGAFAFSAVWYTSMSKVWILAAGIPLDAQGKPMGNGSAMPFVIGIIANLLVAGMMRHVFQMGGIDTLGEGVLSGFGIGAFFITPWVTMNYGFSNRKPALAVIDGINAVVGCTIMGAVLTLF